MWWRLTDKLIHQSQTRSERRKFVCVRHFTSACLSPNTSQSVDEPEEKSARWKFTVQTVWCDVTDGWPTERRQFITAVDPQTAEWAEWVWTSVRPTGWISGRMGCTVSFICCEEDFLQMPVFHHEEEEEEETKEKKERVKKVRTVSTVTSVYTCLQVYHRLQKKLCVCLCARVRESRF